MTTSADEASHPISENTDWLDACPECGGVQRAYEWGHKCTECDWSQTDRFFYGPL